MSGYIEAMAIHASKLPLTASGLAIPATTKRPRWLAVVVGVAPDVAGFAFGDIIEISGSAHLDGRAIGYPAFFLFSETGQIPTQGFWFESVDGMKRIPCTFEESMVILHPDEVLFKHCAWDWDRCEPGLVGMFPTGNRILALHRPRPSRSARIEDPGWYRHPTLAHEPYARVIACGPDVREVKPWDWIVFAGDRGSRIRMDDGRVFTSIEERDVIAIVYSHAHINTPVEWISRDSVTMAERLRRADELASQFGPPAQPEEDDPLRPYTSEEFEELMENARS